MLSKNAITRLACVGVLVLAGMVANTSPAGAATGELLTLHSRGMGVVSPEDFPPGYTYMENYHFGLCLTIASSGSEAFISACNFSGSNHEQAWKITFALVYGGHDWYEIANYHTGACLDDEPGALTTLPCNANHAQLWRRVVGDVAVGWQDFHTGLVIDANAVHGAFTDPWTGNHSQQWLS